MINENTDQNNVIKIILLGNSETGKTSLINAYNGKQFDFKSFSTIGSQFIRKQLKLNEKKFNVQIWDTAGQERYRSVNKIYIKGSHIVIFVYDVTNMNSFSDLSDFWFDYVEKILGNDITLGLAGNKVDLIESIKVSIDEGQKLANKIGALFRETSAKVHPKGIIDFINELVNDYISKHLNEMKEFRDSFNLYQKEKNIVDKNNKRGDCC